MDDETVIEGDGYIETMFAGQKTEDDKQYFERFRSAERALELDDFELGHSLAASTGGAGRRIGVAGLAFLAALSALAGAFPGPAAGLIPLAMDVLSITGPLLAALLAFLAVALALKAQRSGPDSSAPDFALRRTLFPGSGPMRIGIGDTGLQLNFPRRFFRLHWASFDAATLMAADLNGDGLPSVTLGQIGSTRLETLFDPNLDNEDIAALIEASSEWAATNSVLRLPIKIDQNFAVRKSKDKTEPLAPLVSQREFVSLNERYFASSHEGDGLSWPRFVAACVFMIQLRDPDWVE